MRHVLTRELREWRETLVNKRREGGRRAKREVGEEIEAER
jgi:hypothetical protein